MKAEFAKFFYCCDTCKREEQDSLFFFLQKELIDFDFEDPK